MKHYIILKLKKGTDVPALAKKAEEIFGLTLSVPGVESVEVFSSCSDLPGRFDLMIKIEMAPEALPVYDACEPHQQWRRLCDPLLENKVIFDCE